MRERLDYDLETGIFTWVYLPWKSQLIGKRAGYVNPEGYRVIVIDCCRYMAHNLAWFWCTGKWPQEEIDHIDRKRDNNSIDNLRPVNDVEQAANKGFFCTNTSGYKGVHFNKRQKRYKAKIFGGNDGIHLGYFDDPKEAALAYDRAALSFFGDYARVNFPEELGLPLDRGLRA